MLLDQNNKTIALYKNEFNYTTNVASALQVVLMQDTTVES